MKSYYISTSERSHPSLKPKFERLALMRRRRDAEDRFSHDHADDCVRDFADQNY